MNIGADLEVMARLLRPRDFERLKGGAAPTIKAPCCGRQADVDSVLDVRGVPGIGHDFLCSACRHRLIADKQNDWTHSRLARAAGLGWPEVREHRIRELAAEEEIRDGRIDRHATQRRLRREVPETNIPGTEAPPGIVWVRR